MTVVVSWLAREQAYALIDTPTTWPKSNLRPALRVWIDALVDSYLTRTHKEHLIGLRSTCVFAWLIEPEASEIPKGRIAVALNVEPTLAYTASKSALGPLLGPGATELLLHRLCDQGERRDILEEELPFLESPSYRMYTSEGSKQLDLLSATTLQALVSAVEPEISEYVTSIERLHDSMSSIKNDTEVLVTLQSLISARLA